jgi:hypothetical protein
MTLRDYQRAVTNQMEAGFTFGQVEGFIDPVQSTSSTRQLCGCEHGATNPLKRSGGSRTRCCTRSRYKATLRGSRAVNKREDACC